MMMGYREPQKVQIQEVYIIQETPVPETFGCVAGTLVLIYYCSPNKSKDCKISPGEKYIHARVMLWNILIR